MTFTTDSPKSPPWRYVWALALAIVVVVVGGWELLLRSADLGPEYTDNRSLWADTRHRLNGEGLGAVAVIGASRVQRGIDVDLMSERLGRPVFQLAVEGTSALAVLEDLAVDPRFRGTVIYSVAPAFTFNRFQPRVDSGKQREWLEHYATQSQSRRIEQSMRLWLQGRLAFRSTDAKLTRVVPELLQTGLLPERDQKTTLANRVVLMDYAKMPVEANEIGMMQLYLENSAPYSKGEWEAALNYFASLVGILRAKGSDVIFLRLPSGKQVGALEGVFYPRKRFWARMEERVDASFVYTPDHPQLEGFVSVDGSHIESPRIAEFTENLIPVLIEAGLASANAAP